MGAQIQTKTEGPIGPRPTPISGEFSARQSTAALLELPSFEALSSEQAQVFEKQLGQASWTELKSLAQERDPELYYMGLIQLGHRLQNRDQSAWAIRLFSAAASQSILPDLAKRAQTSIDALEGRGEVGARAEVLLSRFSKDFADPAMIAPMLIGSSVGGLARGLGLSRLAAAPATWFSRGVGARITAGSLAYAAEVPAFVLSGRALRSTSSQPQPSWGHDFATGALSLGAIKILGAVGKQSLAQIHGINEFGIMTRGAALAKYSQPLIQQASLFSGLMTSHWAETQLGLRPKVDGATAMTDTLVSMFNLGAGMRLGQGLLGSGYARSMGELEWRTQSLEKAVELPVIELPKLNSKTTAAASGLGLFLQSNLALASDNAGRWNNQTLAATILSSLVIGGSALYGFYRLRRGFVAPSGTIRSLGELKGDIPTMLPARLAKETDRALDLLKDSLSGSRRGDAEAIETSSAFLETSLPRLAPKERVKIFSAWIDLLLDGKENFAAPCLATLKRAMPHLDAAGRESLLDKVLMATRARQPDKALTAFFLLNGLAAELSKEKRREVYDRAVEALEFQHRARDGNVDNNARLLMSQRALLRELRDFLDQELQSTQRELRDELYELKKDPDGGLIPSVRQNRIMQLEEQIKNPPEKPAEEMLQKFIAQSEDPNARFFNLEDALTQAHKLMELFDESSDYRPPNFQAEFGLRAHLNEAAMKAYLRDGHRYINRTSSSAIQETLAEILLGIKPDTQRGKI